ncbi:MAG TPA: hypothetical protein VKU00_17020 [Chthonomonadaceae bacterium]|nr:hypothetical protein [Chthonomonadaceae bacterium]
MHPEFQPTAGRSILRRMPLLAALLIAISSALLLTGCGNGTSTANQTLVRSIIAYVPAPGADGSLTLIGNNTFLTGGNVGFGQVANGGGYISITSGPFSATASGPTVTTPIALNGQTLSGNNTAYTLIAVGEAGQTGTFVPQLLLIPNFAGSPAIPTGDAAIRVVNVSLNPNNIGLYATSSGAPSAVLTAGLNSIPYGYSAATNAYVYIPTAQLTNMALVDVTNTHTALSLSSASNLNTSTFTPGQAYTLYIIGQPGNSAEPLTALWVVDFPSS